MKQVIVIGGGAAGMMAAIAAAEGGARVRLLEQNEKLGKKIYITGKGRCNLTNACEAEDFFSAVLRNPKFLYSAFYTFSNDRVQDFFRENGLKIKVERGERVFPVSDHASDVIATLQKKLRECSVEILLHHRVKDLLVEENVCKGVVLGNNTKLSADAVILATGGLSYPSTGSTGDGLRFAQKTGHKVTECEPALVPFTTREDWILDLQGLSLKNVTVTIFSEGKAVFQEFGEMLFTHFGVSGPLLLRGSSKLKKRVFPLPMEVDLKPALSVEQLDKRLLRELEENAKKAFKNAVTGLFPGKLTPVMVRLSGIDPEKAACEVTKAERQQFVNLIKHLPMTLTGIRDFKEAIITRGGVCVKEVNPSTMESKRISGLYFAGEMLDVDALTGGFNLQIAWSTGYLAGYHAAQEN